MERAIAFPRSDERELSLRWSGRVSLTPRILAVNIFALAMLAGGFFYLDSYRARIVDSLELLSHLLHPNRCAASVGVKNGFRIVPHEGSRSA